MATGGTDALVIFGATGDLAWTACPAWPRPRLQSGLYAGRRVRRRASAEESAAAPDKPFRHRDLGSAAYISRGRAVVSARPLQLGGFIAWWI